MQITFGPQIRHRYWIDLKLPPFDVEPSFFIAKLLFCVAKLLFVFGEAAFLCLDALVASLLCLGNILDQPGFGRLIAQRI
jgi:hypothetical protein